MNEDNPLKSLLQVWKVSPKPHPGFREGVWERIAAKSAGSPSGVWASINQWFVISLPRPAYACVLIAAFAGAGFAVADMHAARVHQRQKARMEQRYLASIDPVAMADSALHPQP
jgi:hypothetical protein